MARKPKPTKEILTEARFYLSHLIEMWERAGEDTKDVRAVRTGIERLIREQG